MYLIPPPVELAELERQRDKTSRNIKTLEVLGQEENDTSGAVNDLIAQLESITARIGILRFPDGEKA